MVKTRTMLKRPEKRCLMPAFFLSVPPEVVDVVRTTVAELVEPAEMEL